MQLLCLPFQFQKAWCEQSSTELTFRYPVVNHTTLSWRVVKELMYAPMQLCKYKNTSNSIETGEIHYNQPPSNEPYAQWTVWGTPDAIGTGQVNVPLTSTPHNVECYDSRRVGHRKLYLCRTQCEAPNSKSAKTKSLVDAVFDMLNSALRNHDISWWSHCTSIHDRDRCCRSRRITAKVTPKLIYLYYQKMCL